MNQIVSVLNQTKEIILMTETETEIAHLSLALHLIAY